MKLIIEYYTPDNNDRNNEYLYCIEKNIESKLFEQTHIFVEEGSKLPDRLANKVNVYYDKRRTFQDLFNFCNEHFPNEICVIANTDIMFDETIKHVNKDNIEGKFICLTRWDILPDGEVKLYREDTNTSYGSQDTWIFKAPTLLNNADFFMGKPGCDHKIVYLADKVGLGVINPSKKIITKHLHNSKYRTYKTNGEDSVSKPWLGLYPTDDINKESQKKNI